MSLQAALSTALTSLAAEQRQSAVLANNIANANTEGYVRRVLPRSENLVAGSGAGVSTGNAQRAADAALAAASRTADAHEAYAQTLQKALETFNNAVGQASDERSLSHRLGAFQEALTSLSSAPANAVAQSQALSSAQDLADSLHQMAASVSAARSQADQAVAQDVAAVNSALDSLSEVDRQMAYASARGASTAEFEDKRDTLIAEIGRKVPLQIFDNGPGQLILMSDGGSTLYDSTTVHPLQFTHTAAVSAAAGSAGLSKVTVDGQVLRLSGSGSVRASLMMRDEILPRFNDMLDQVATQLANAFQQADGTGSGGAAGLFTDPANIDGGGLPIWTRLEGSDSGYPVSGLAGRIAINPSADPDQGGDAWRMRTGMAAAGEGGASDNSWILNALDQMEATRSYATGSGLPSKMGLGQAASQSIGLMQGERAVWTDRAQSRANLALQAREELTNKTAVNVDEELQRLMLVQQTYSASVQIIQAAAKMLDDLTQIR
jgi:flagellar hook-associated protein 1 FlgK